MINKAWAIRDKIQSILMTCNDREIRYSLHDLYRQIEPYENKQESVVIPDPDHSESEDRLKDTERELNEANRTIALLESQLIESNDRLEETRNKLAETRQEVINASAEQFSKILDPELGLDLSDMSNEEKFRMAAKFMEEKDDIVAVRQKIDNTIADIGTTVDNNTVTQLVIGNGHNRAITFNLPYVLSILHLQTVTTAWMQRLQKRIKEVQNGSQK